ncbi:ribbon-helix-helix protein, CopG family [Haloarchaeobius sp. DFWS5]|uniref:ribbon-helix-helix protein, CopG family n=1 Tax=Haloarchaeobius sp. DFWS5 TaxID=3446114 RepID=UPI003EBED8E7
MARRDNQINVYLDSDLYREIEARADESGQSRSGYIADVLEAHVQNDLTSEVSHETAVERRIEELVAHATEEVTDATGGLEEAILKTGVYSVAAWELVKGDHGEVARQQAVEAGRRRLREEANHLGASASSKSEHEMQPQADDEDSSDGEDDGWYF